MPDQERRTAGDGGEIEKGARVFRVLAEVGHVNARAGAETVAPGVAGPAVEPVPGEEPPHVIVASGVLAEAVHDGHAGAGGCRSPRAEEERGAVGAARPTLAALDRGHDAV
jgi:hypothetical protein